MLHLNEVFDWIVCVNLDDAKERWAACEKEFAKHGLEVTRFPAVPGYLVPRAYGLATGYAGMVRSHYEIIAVAKESGFSNVLLLEDDVEFVPDLHERFTEIWPRVPQDWEMLYLGGYHRICPTPIARNVARLVCTFTLHCTAFSVPIYDTLLHRLGGIAREPGDVTCARLQSEHVSYGIWPPLAWQRPGFSFTEERFTDHYCLMRTPDNDHLQLDGWVREHAF